MEWYSSAILIFSGLILLIFTGVPVAFAILLLSMSVMWSIYGWDLTVNFLATTCYDTATSYTFIAAPLFIFMGTIFTYSGIGESMCGAIYKWLKFLPGNLVVTSFVGCAIFGAMSGSTTATTAAIGSITTPQMLKYGYNKKLATGCVAIGGGLGPIIPPSVFLIIYGMTTQQSIGDLFIASLTPGILLTVMLSSLAVAYCMINPSLAPKATVEIKIEKRDLILGVVSPMIIIFVVLGTIYLGVTTPVEAAGLGCITAIIIGCIMKTMDMEALKKAAYESLKTTCMILFLLIAAALFSKLIVLMMIAKNMGTYVINAGLPSWGIISAMMVVVFIAGFFIEGCAIITILVPVFSPIVQSIGFDPILFGVLFTINLCMGAVTPPFAVNLFVMSGIAPEVPFLDIAEGAFWFLPAEILLMILIVVFPGLSLWPIAH